MTAPRAAEPVLLVERHGRVALLTLNRPAKLNALSRQMMRELAEAVVALGADAGVGAIVLTGAGDRAFSAGGDMAEQVAALDEAEAPAQAGPDGHARAWPSAAAAMRACPAPVIAAVRGYCYGGGALLAVACDLRVGGSDARFKFHGASYGQAVGGATLPRVVGEPRAKELLFTCDEVLAEEALRIGLLNRVVPPDQVVPAALAMAERIAANSPGAVASIKQSIHHAVPVESAVAHEETANATLRRSPDSAARFRRAAARVLEPDA